MGLADLLAQIHVPYDSEEALTRAAGIAQVLTAEGRAASAELGSRPGQTLSLLQETGRHDCRECAV